MFLTKNKILLFVCITSYSYLYGYDFNPTGTWKFTSIKKYHAFNIASRVGYGLLLKFNKNKTVQVVNYRSKQVNPPKHTWEIFNGNTIHIQLKTNSNIISRFIMRNSINDYLKIIKKINKNCFLVNSYHGKSIVKVKMCKK